MFFWTVRIKKTVHLNLKKGKQELARDAWSSSRFTISGVSQSALGSNELERVELCCTYISQFT